ncbi:MAG: hypothetical protein HQL32_00885 [Planctomycetes bacterium]|nr:hypothetical protein [Planctomycetota bacterium]
MKTILSTALISLSLTGSSIATSTKAKLFSSTKVYYAQKNFSSEDKSDLDIYGIYAFLGYGNHSIECEYDKVDRLDDYDQDDTSFIYNNYSLSNWKFKGGIHLSNENDADTSIYIAGLNYTRTTTHGYALWHAGTDIYLAEGSENSFQEDFMQISPSIGKYFGMTTSPNYLHTGLTLNWQKYNEAMGGEDQYMWANVNLTLIAPRWSLGVEGSLGESYNSLSGGGLIFSNDYIKKKESLGVKFSKKISKNFDLSLKGTKTDYEDALNEEDDYTLISATLGYTF